MHCARIHVDACTLHAYTYTHVPYMHTRTRMYHASIHVHACSSIFLLIINHHNPLRKILYSTVTLAISSTLLLRLVLTQRSTAHCSRRNIQTDHQQSHPFPLVHQLQYDNTKQTLFAYDEIAGGHVHHLHHWWSKLCYVGPSFSYFPNLGKTWLIVKDHHLSRATELFADTGVNITTEGKRHLGAALDRDPL